MPLYRTTTRWRIHAHWNDGDIIIFPIDGHIVYVRHSDLVAIGKLAGYTKTKSWRNKGGYSTPRANANVRALTLAMSNRK